MPGFHNESRAERLPAHRPIPRPYKLTVRLAPHQGAKLEQLARASDLEPDQYAETILRAHLDARNIVDATTRPLPRR